MWRYDADVLGQTHVTEARFATGLRNATAFAFEPSTGEPFGFINGRDQLYDNWPALFTPEEDLALPSEELFALGEGRDYGWPYCFHDPDQDQKVLAPEYGGDGEEVARCDDVEEPVAVLPAHWSPLSMLFYRGEQLPAKYQGGLFAANHGSRFEPDATGDLPGYNVIFIPFADGEPSGDWEVFADELADEFAGDARPLPTMAEHRPIGLLEGNDGSLFISDDQGGRIWRVVYTGD